MSEFYILAPYKTMRSSSESISLSLMILFWKEYLIIWHTFSLPPALQWLEDLEMVKNTANVNNSSFLRKWKQKQTHANILKSL